MSLVRLVGRSFILLSVWIAAGCCWWMAGFSSYVFFSFVFFLSYFWVFQIVSDNNTGWGSVKTNFTKFLIFFLFSCEAIKCCRVSCFFSAFEILPLTVRSAANLSRKVGWRRRRRRSDGRKIRKIFRNFIFLWDCFNSAMNIIVSKRILTAGYLPFV